MTATAPGLDQLSAAELDALIAALIARRAGMSPGPSVEPPAHPAPAHRFDDLLWTVRPAADRAAVELLLYHPGLGWTAMLLSRAQVEGLQTACLFALDALPTRTSRSAAARHA